MHLINSEYSDYMSLLLSFFTAHTLYSLCGDKESHNLDPVSSYIEWLPMRLQHLRGAKEDIRVPDKATKITSPLVPEQWHRYLDDYPDKTLKHFFISGIMSGLRLGCTASSSTLKSSHRNLMSTLEHPEVAEEYLTTKLSQSRIAGPFRKETVPNAHISRFGVIPKKATGKWRLIVDLSHLPSASVNDTIPKELCSLNYISVDTAIQPSSNLVQAHSLQSWMSRVHFAFCQSTQRTGTS